MPLLHLLIHLLFKDISPAEARKQHPKTLPIMLHGQAGILSSALPFFVIFAAFSKIRAGIKVWGNASQCRKKENPWPHFGPCSSRRTNRMQPPVRGIIPTLGPSRVTQRYITRLRHGGDGTRKWVSAVTLCGVLGTLSTHTQTHLWKEEKTTRIYTSVRDPWPGLMQGNI